MATIRIAIMSDIHADESENVDTRIFVEHGPARRGQFPMSDLDRLVASKGIVADYLLLPGDTANRANAEGLQYGWRRAHGVASMMGAKLIATAGNHDVITHSPSLDRSWMLRNLLPSFPTGGLTTDSAYWDRGWCVIEESDHRILVLDSTADFPNYPVGYASDSTEMKTYFNIVDRGGLRVNVEQELEEYLETAPPKLNVALVHHHPLEHQLRVHLQDAYGAMRRGSEIVEILTRAHRSGRWLIVHGHKHIPQLVSATTISANGPIVLCAGSLGAKIWDPINTVARNQFHIVDLQVGPNSEVLGLAGSIESFTWGVGVGWYQSERRGSGLPGWAGFGSLVEPRMLASRIDTLVPRSPGAFTDYHEIVAQVPELPFVMPVDEEALEEIAATYGLSFVRVAERITSIAREVSYVR